jgi:cytochrome c oxidase subunit 2
LRRKNSLITLLTVTAVAVLALSGVAHADLLTPESGGSPNADRIDTLYKILLAIAAVIFFGVEGILIYCCIKFRARKGAVAAQIRGNTRLEIGWTVGAAVILVFIATVTFLMLPGIRTPENSGPNGLNLASADNTVLAASSERRLPPNGKSLNIEVNGQQYVWRYSYPDGDTNQLNNVFAYEEMVVPTDTTVTLDIVAQDVAHSWWIPKLGGKKDAIPGYTNHTWFKISKPGVYDGQCAELCGRNHANMVARVRAVTPDRFQAWYAGQKRNIEAANKAAQAQRKQIGTPQPRSQGNQNP